MYVIQFGEYSHQYSFIPLVLCRSHYSLTGTAVTVNEYEHCPSPTVYTVAIVLSNNDKKTIYQKKCDTIKPPLRQDMLYGYNFVPPHFL